MSALFERAQKTVVMITSVPVTSAELDTATWLNLSCTIKQASFTAGQKNDIDVTTLCSDETENINGLPAPSEMSLSGNFYRNPAQDKLSAGRSGAVQVELSRRGTVPHRWRWGTVLFFAVRFELFTGFKAE